ncbi:MAG: glycosyltransferase family 4 protein [Coriobacteriia bacterium]|nr:glycosyltransferase family 4 protein [Coriobacteriia bacterium]
MSKTHDKADKIAVGIICDEAGSLFEGGTSLPRFGGAGLHMYLLGKGLSANPRYDVRFIFTYTPPVNLHEDNISFIWLKTVSHALERRLARWIPPLRNALGARPYRNLPEKRVFITTMADFAPHLIEQANYAEAKTIFQTACELDVTQPYERTPEDGAVLLDTIAACDQVFVQTEAQRDNLRANRGKDSIAVHKGWPAPLRRPSISGRDYVLWVGSAQMVKQPWLFFDTARLLPDIPFVGVMPPAVKSVADYARRQASELPNVTLIDKQLGYREVQEYFGKAAVYLYTTEFGTHPELTVIQAAVGGAAIVSERLDPDDGMFVRKECGLVTGVGANRLAAGITTVLDDVALRETHTQNAFDYVAHHYSYEGMIEAYEEVIDGFFA